MYKIHDIVSKYHLKPIKYTIDKKLKILLTNEGNYVIKDKKRVDKQNIYQYLLSRNFTYFPLPLNNLEKDDYEIYPYITEIKVPKEQKAQDMMYFLSLLHNKTTFYKEVDLDDIKNFYENVFNKLVYLEQYYFDLQNTIENNIYMSPSEYLLIRNITIIYKSINFCKEQLQTWYDIMSKKRKQRYVMTHNNLDLEHFIRGEQSVFINWDKAKIGSPVDDLYNFYQNNHLAFDFNLLLDIYESKYPLLKEEKIWLLILLSIPSKIVLDNDEFHKCQEIVEQLNDFQKLYELISKQYPKKAHE